MFGSCSEPVKAKNIISYGTRDSQHPIRIPARKRRQLTTGRPPVVSAVMRTAFVLRGSESFECSEPQETNLCNK